MPVRQVSETFYINSHLIIFELPVGGLSLGLPFSLSCCVLELPRSHWVELSCKRNCKMFWHSYCWDGYLLVIRSQFEWRQKFMVFFSWWTFTEMYRLEYWIKSKNLGEFKQINFKGYIQCPNQKLFLRKNELVFVRSLFHFEFTYKTTI